jgi:hypothetical protein
MLNKIMTPTGGSEEFVYEQNDCAYSQFVNNKLAGLRIALHKLVDDKGNLQVKKYAYINKQGNSSGILNGFPLQGAAYSPTPDSNLAFSTTALTTGNIILNSFTNSRTDLEIVDGSNVGYSRVLIKDNIDNGYIEKTFTTRDEFPLEEPKVETANYFLKFLNFARNNGGYFPAFNNNSLLIGKLKTVRKYDKNNVLVQEEINEYTYKIFEDIIQEVVLQSNDVLPGISSSEPHSLREFVYYPKIHSQRNLMTTTTGTTINQGNKITEKSNTVYDENYPIVKKSESSTNDSGDTLWTENSYPSDLLSLPLMNNLISANRVSDPVQIISSRKAGQVSEILSTKQIEFGTFTRGGSNLVLPKSIKLTKGQLGASNSLNTQVFFHEYDKYGNLSEVSNSEGMHQVYLWGYNYAEPIAKIENATYTDVMSALGKSSSDDLSYLQGYTEIKLVSEIQKIKTSLNNAMVTGYTYRPSIGINSIIDEKDDWTYYEYDGLNRLSFIRDKNKNLLKQYLYSYRGGVDTSTPPDLVGQTINPDVNNLALEIKIGDFKEYKIPVPCLGIFDWKDQLLPNSPNYNINSCHPSLYFPDPTRLGVDFHPPYQTLGPEYLDANLPFPRTSYTCGYFTTRKGYSYEIISNTSKPYSIQDAKWSIEVNGTRTQLTQLKEVPNVFFIPKCLDGIYGRIICSANLGVSRTVGLPITEFSKIELKSNLTKFNGGLILEDRMLTVNDPCSNKQLTRNLTNNSTQTDTGLWKDAPWTRNIEVVVNPFKIYVYPFRSYNIPISSYSPDYLWDGISNPSMHPLFYFSRIQPGTIPGGTAFETFFKLPYPAISYKGLYVSRSGYRFNRSSLVSKITDPNYTVFNWYIELDNTGQQIPIVTPPESNELFFIPPSLAGKSGKLICIITVGSRNTVSSLKPIVFQSDSIIFQLGLYDDDNLNYNPRTDAF